VKIDVTAEQGGYIADAARTVILAPSSSEAARLHRTAVVALDEAVRAARAGARVSAIGRAVEQRARADGFSVVRELCGHGVGRAIHEEPSVPNYEMPFSRDVLTDGLVIAIEPMLSARRTRAVQMPDGWTIRTGDGSLAVHEEHTIIVRGERPIVVTAA
jgi:methionyl aminopeptidase